MSKPPNPTSPAMPQPDDESVIIWAQQSNDVADMLRIAPLPVQRANNTFWRIPLWMHEARLAKGD